MNRFFVFILWLGSAMGILNAQPAGQTNTGRKAWFACIDLPATLENPVKIMAGEQIIDLELTKYMTSAAVKIPADGMLRMVRQVPDPLNQGKTKWLVLAEARVAEDIREALIILLPLPKPEADLVFKTRVQNLASFKGGDRMYLNLSDTNIAVQLGETNVPVPAQQMKIYSSPSFAEPTNLPIVFRFYHPQDQKWKIFNASTVVIRPTRREIYIFNNGSRLGNIKKHMILFPVDAQQPGADNEATPNP